jgi:DNA-binding NtrC family response regulator
MKISLIGPNGKFLSLEEIEGIVIQVTLFRCRFNMAETAKELDIGRSTLYRKLKARD